REALADEPALAVAAVRVEAVADHGLAVALDVGDQRDVRQRHLGEVDVRIGDRRGDRHRLLADVDDAQRTSPSLYPPRQGEGRIALSEAKCDPGGVIARQPPHTTALLPYGGLTHLFQCG